MYMKPQKKDFTLKQTKLKDGIVHIEGIAEFATKDRIDTQKINDDFTFEPHEDLIKPFAELKAALAFCHGHKLIETLVMSSEFKADAKQKKQAESALASEMMDIKVNGVSLSGKDQNRGCVIMGTYDGQAINSKRIRFIGGGLGFEDRIDDACKLIIDETYKYLYEQKRGEIQELTDANQTEIDDKSSEDVQSDS